MKNRYTSPQLEISKFCTENITTTSGDIDGITLTQAAMNQYNVTEIEQTALNLFYME